MRSRIVIAALLSIGSVTTIWAQGQNSASYLSQAFIRVTDSASGAAKLGNFGYDDGISILAAWVDCRDSVMYYVPLTKGVNYMFVAGGDNDSQDVNLEIQNADGKTVASENRVAADAMLTLTAPTTDWYTLKLTLAKSRANLPCVCVACILKEDGHQVPLKQLDDSADRLMKLFTETDKLLQKENKRLEFRRARNQWGLYGSVLAQGQKISVTNLDLGAGRRLFLGLGDKNTEDVDLFILDAKGNVAAADQKANSEAIIGFTPANERYGLRMLNFKGSGPAVIMTGIFDVLQR